MPTNQLGHDGPKAPPGPPSFLSPSPVSRRVCCTRDTVLQAQEEEEEEEEEGRAVPELGPTNAQSPPTGVRWYRYQ